MTTYVREAPGAPGGAPRWTDGQKTAVGTAVGPGSCVWFTVANGIVTEVYYPQVDVANIRDAQLLVAAEDFFSEEQRDTAHEIHPLDPWAPAVRLRNTCRAGRYQVIKDVLTDPERSVLLQRIAFMAREGAATDYRLFYLLAPHIGNQGDGNSAWVADDGGEPMLFARRGETFLALAASPGFVRRSVGFVGVSDGWQDVSRHRGMTWEYGRAENGNVALCGELALPVSNEVTVAVAFGPTPAAAAQQARASLLKGFEQCRQEYVAGWRAAVAPARDLSPVAGDGGRLFRASVQMLLSHTDKRTPGATVASLAIPWGESHGDRAVGGYHLVWTRDLVESALALLAVDDNERAWQALLYLASIQRADGSWPQNNWLDGATYWSGIQLDETALPIVLAWRLRDEAARRHVDTWPLMRRAAAFLALNGPVTPQERWEEASGYSPSTLAVSIAALICAADVGRQAGEQGVAAYLEGVADWWASKLDAWTFTSAGEAVPGQRRHYQRLGMPQAVLAHGQAGDGTIGIANSAAARANYPASTIVDAGFLELVRYGVRAASDERIRSSLAAVDALLKRELPCGPGWRRYDHDGYGEHADGAPFDGSGVGRIWPLLTGERAQYELAAGNRREARRLARVMECLANEGALLPEQTWDAADVPEHSLVLGRPTGSATPLLWAHAEYLRLLRGLADGKPFDLLPPVADRYRSAVPARRSVWRFNHKVRLVAVGEPLRVEARAAFRLHWTLDHWLTWFDSDAAPSGIGSWFVDIPSSAVGVAGDIAFTFLWLEDERWEGENFTVCVG